MELMGQSGNKEKRKSIKQVKNVLSAAKYRGVELVYLTRGWKRPFREDQFRWGGDGEPQAEGTACAEP